MNKKIIIGVSVLALPLMSLFQNCSGQNFKKEGGAVFSSSANGIENSMPVSINMPDQSYQDEPSQIETVNNSNSQVGENSSERTEVESTTECGGDDDDQVLGSNKSKGNFINQVHSKSVVLICNQEVNSINNIHEDAKVIIVNGKINYLNMLNKNAELILVNSELVSIKQEAGAVIKLNSSEGASYIQHCREGLNSSLGANDSNFQVKNSTEKVRKLASDSSADVLSVYITNKYDITNSNEVASKTSMIMITNILEGAVLQNKTTNSLDVNQIHKNAQLKVKTDSFVISGVHEGAVLELY